MKIKEENKTIQLEIFNGYTIDFRLKQFRKVDYSNKTIEFIEFNSKKGQQLLKEYYKKKLQS